MMDNMLLERFGALDKKIAFLEGECNRLRCALGARTSGHPMELGHTFYPPGDPVPSRGGPNEHLVGFVYTHLRDSYLVVTRFLKNLTGKIIHPGEKLPEGVVDTRLSHPVEPNDYFYAEI
jgi:hypothetical protein